MDRCVRNDPVNHVDPDGFLMEPRGWDPWCFTIHRLVLETDESRRGQRGWGGQRPSWQLSGMNLAKTVKGPYYCDGGSGSGAIESRIGALNRAKAAMGMLQAITAGSVIDASMIAAIGIRETGFRNIYGNSYQDNQGNWHENLGRGVFQIDIGQHPEVSESLAMNTTWAATWAMNYLRANYSNWCPETSVLTRLIFSRHWQHPITLALGIISGNPDTIDVGSTNNNYGSNILDLMACFK